MVGCEPDGRLRRRLVVGGLRVAGPVAEVLVSERPRALMPVDQPITLELMRQTFYSAVRFVMRSMRWAIRISRRGFS